MAIGEIRLIGINRAFERKTLEVTGGDSYGEYIGLAEAEALVAAGEACWVWKDDRLIEPAQPPELQEAPPEPVVTLADIAARIQRAKEIAGKMEPLPPVGADGAPLSAEELALREAYPEEGAP